jgi:nucleoside 2-deoxyribosyltransferase
MKLYLAHPIGSRKGVRSWEMEMEAKHPGLELINPFYDTERVDIHEIDAGRMSRFGVDPDGIVNADVDLIMKSDGMVAIINGDVSYGTVMEIVYAFLNHKPVYVICTNGYGKHPWLNYHATKVFIYTNDFEVFLKGLMDGETVEGKC